MTHNSHSFLLVLFLISNMLLAAVAGREIPTDSKNVDKKQPEWFIDPDGSILIPGLGRVMVPSLGYSTPYSGSSGGTGGLGGQPGGSYIPGGDDTFVPNPGFEFPNPAGGGFVPAAVRP